MVNKKTKDTPMGVLFISPLVTITKKDSPKLFARKTALIFII